MNWKLLKKQGLWASIKDNKKRNEHLKKVARNIRKHRKTCNSWLTDPSDLTPEEYEAHAESEVRQMAQFGVFTLSRSSFDPETGERVEYQYEYEQHTDGHVMVWREEIF